jgi:hypothetical protein
MKSFVFTAHICSRSALEKCGEVVGSHYDYHFPTLEQAVAKQVTALAAKDTVVTGNKIKVQAPLNGLEYGFTYECDGMQTRYQQEDLSEVKRQWKVASKSKHYTNVSEIYVEVVLS